MSHSVVVRSAHNGNRKDSGMNGPAISGSEKVSKYKRRRRVHRKWVWRKKIGNVSLACKRLKRRKMRSKANGGDGGDGSLLESSAGGQAFCEAFAFQKRNPGKSCQCRCDADGRLMLEVGGGDRGDLRPNAQGNIVALVTVFAPGCCNLHSETMHDASWPLSVADDASN